VDLLSISIFRSEGKGKCSILDKQKRLLVCALIRIMDRAISQGSRLLSKKWAKLDHDRHKAKLRTVRSEVKLTSPPVYSHLQYNSKREQLIRTKYREINRNNRLLFNKIVGIRSKRIGRLPPKASSVRSLNEPRRRREIE
jgi:hypothetical protein